MSGLTAETPRARRKREGKATPPSEKTVRAAVREWTVAKIRWAEFALAQPGGEAYRELLPFANLRHSTLLAAETRLLVLGNRILVAAAREKR